MRKFLIKFLVFLAALEGLARVDIRTLLLALAVVMAVLACLHILSTPESDAG
jgi:hypothetical protein